MSATRVVITGIGMVGPTGCGKERFWQALLARESAVSAITRFDASGYNCRVAGEVRDKSYEECVDPRKLRTTTLAAQLALAAGEYALRDARLSPGLYQPAERGVVVGTALGGLREAEQQMAILLERGSRRINPFIAAGIPSHTPGVELAALIGAQGPQVTIATGCASATQAIAHGAALIRAGDAGMCVVGGFETPLFHVVFAGLTRTQELATRNDEPDRASRPFDLDHGGMVLAEGSCMLVLEAEERAMRRGAHVYAVVLGGGVSCDALGVYGVDPTGRIAAEGLRGALARSHLMPTDIDYVCSHANSLPSFDHKESLVLRQAFGDQVESLPVSSIKGIMGHPFGASGAFQAAACCLALEEQTLPPNANLEHPDPECRLNLVGAEPRRAELGYTLVTSYGYGGVNAFLLLGRA